MTKAECYEYELKILRSLLERRKHFNELLNAGFQISPQTLTTKLGILKKANVITKETRKSPYKINWPCCDLVVFLLMDIQKWAFYTEYPIIDYNIVVKWNLNNQYVVEENTKDELKIQRMKIEDFKNKLRLSKSFFEVFLEKDPNSLQSIFMDILVANAGIVASTKKGLNYFEISDPIFKDCVNSDIIAGHKNNDAIQYIKKINEKEIYLQKFLNPISARFMDDKNSLPLLEVDN